MEIEMIKKIEAPAKLQIYIYNYFHSMKKLLAYPKLFKWF